MNNKRKTIFFSFLAIFLVALVSGSYSVFAKQSTITAPRQDSCPPSRANCVTPQMMRTFYGVQTLTDRGFTGKGQSVVVIVSFGSSTLQQDLDAFSQQYNLPKTQIKQLFPLGPVGTDSGWAEETTLDVELIHAMAPDAAITVLASPVAETEGTIGLPEFLKLEQYAVTNHLGTVINHSYGASELTLDNADGRKLVQDYATFYKDATINQGITFLAASGDNGARDYQDETHLSQELTTSFPNDVPWVTSVGGTTARIGSNRETAWNGSGGGLSRFFSEPDFQTGLPSAQQSLLKGQRGVPDIAANADPATAMDIYYNGRWRSVGGTSASTPAWSGMIAVADQYAARPLGFINPGLYKLGASAQGSQYYRDITIGNNKFTNDRGQTLGYDATAGWDAVTGWGSPHADQFIPALVDALKPAN